MNVDIPSVPLWQRARPLSDAELANIPWLVSLSLSEQERAASAMRAATAQAGDLLCRIVARSNADLQRVIDEIVAYQGILRASTLIALAEQVRYRTIPLVRKASGV